MHTLHTHIYGKVYSENDDIDDGDENVSNE